MKLTQICAMGNHQTRYDNANN